MQQQQNAQGTYANNQASVTASALRLRLDTKSLLEEIELFLKGYKLVLKEQKGKIVTQKIKIGEPKANAEGIQGVLNRLTLILNPSIVQGNYDDDRYKFEIASIRRSMAKSMMINLHNWEIKETNYMEIIDSIMTAVKAYLSRLIDNKERESYEATLRTIESAVTKEGGGFKLPFT